MASRRDTLSLQRRVLEIPHSAGSPHAKAAAPAAPVSALAPAPAPAPTTKPKPKPPPQPQPSTSTVESITSIVPVSTASVIVTAPPTDVSSGLTGSTPPPSAGSEVGTPQPSQSSHTGLIAGIAAGVLVLVVLIAGLLFRTRKRRRKEAWEAEQYQRGGAMNKFSRGNGSSTLGYGDGSDLALHQQLPHYQQDILRQQASKQPAWFAQKSPLDYYKQVPPLAELKRQQHGPMEQQAQQQQQVQKQRPYPLTHEPSSAGSTSSNSSSSGPLSLQEASVAARTLTPVGSEERAPEGESIALSPTSTVSPSVAPQLVTSLQPYRQQQYQQPRISTHALRRPSHPNMTSPISPASASASSNSNPFSPHPNFESPITPHSPTQSGLISSNTLHAYTPPPPSAPVTPVSPPTQPSPGFYDFLLDDEDEKPEKKAGVQLGSPKARSPRNATSNSSSPSRRGGDSPGATSPPPIPRATRPMSVSSISSLKLTSREHKVDASAPEVPAVPALPSLVSP
ncbi:hypothetical protein EC968_001581 [Mortierella alpina]|nr:hypothetical protein EC968_001581 [Mortierella alpina]